MERTGCGSFRSGYKCHLGCSSNLAVVSIIWSQVLLYLAQTQICDQCQKGNRTERSGWISTLKNKAQSTGLITHNEDGTVEYGRACQWDSTVIYTI